MIQTITDFDTSLAGQPLPPAGWTTPTGGGLNLVTDITIDPLGRATQVLGPWHEIDISSVATNIGRATWTIYQDADFRIWSAQGYATDSSPNVDPALRDGGASPSPLATASPPRSVGATSSAATDLTYNYTLINPVSITIMDQSGRITDQISAIRSPRQTTSPNPPIVVGPPINTPIVASWPALASTNIHWPKSLPFAALPKPPRMGSVVLQLHALSPSAVVG